MLWGCLLAMIVWGFIQLFFPPGPVGSTIFALLGAFLFSAYLVGARGECVWTTALVFVARASATPCCKPPIHHALHGYPVCQVFDTQLLIARFDLDDYIWAAINIYLDGAPVEWGACSLHACVRGQVHCMVAAAAPVCHTCTARLLPSPAALVPSPPWLALQSSTSSCELWVWLHACCRCTSTACHPLLLAGVQAPLT